MAKSILVSPAHHLLDINSQSEYYLAAKILIGLAQKNSNTDFHLLCGYFEGKEKLPANLKVYELYSSSNIRLNAFVLVYFYLWLLYKSIVVCTVNKFDLIWHFLPSGPYSLNLFILFRLHRLFFKRRW